jgi:hypothetical protein
VPVSLSAAVSVRPYRRSVSSWSFPPAVPCPGAPLPSAGSLGSVPPPHRYCWSTPTPHPPSHFASLPSLRGTVAASLNSLSRKVGHLTSVSLDLLLPVARPALCHGDDGVSQVPARTLARLPSFSSDPGGIAAPSHSWRLDAASAIDTAFGSPNDHNFEARSRGHRARCLRFAVRVAPPPRKTRYRLVANLCRAGLSPAGFATEGFRS